MLSDEKFTYIRECKFEKGGVIGAEKNSERIEEFIGIIDPFRSLCHTYGIYLKIVLPGLPMDFEAFFFYCVIFT